MFNLTYEPSDLVLLEGMLDEAYSKVSIIEY